MYHDGPPIIPIRSDLSDTRSFVIESCVKVVGEIRRKLRQCLQIVDFGRRIFGLVAERRVRSTNGVSPDLYFSGMVRSFVRYDER
jgi:hypothetical protein